MKISKEEKVKEIKKDLIDAKSKIDLLNRENDKHETFLETLLIVLGEIEVTPNDFYSNTRQPEKTKKDKILDKIVKLKCEYAREDEGTMLQAETISKLEEALHISLNDPKRLAEAGYENELIKLGFRKEFYQGRENWVK